MRLKTKPVKISNNLELALPDEEKSASSPEVENIKEAYLVSGKQPRQRIGEHSRDTLSLKNSTPIPVQCESDSPNLESGSPIKTKPVKISNNLELALPDEEKSASSPEVEIIKEVYWVSGKQPRQRIGEHSGDTLSLKSSTPISVQCESDSPNLESGSPIAVVGSSEVQTNSNVDPISAIQDLVDALKPSTHVLGPKLCTWGGWSLSEVHALLQSVKGDRGKLVEEARRKAGIPSSEDCYCGPLALQTLTKHLARKFNLTLHSLFEMSVETARRTYMNYDIPLCRLRNKFAVSIRTWGGWSLSEVHALLQSVKGDRGKLVEEARRKAGIPSSEDCYCGPLALQTLTTHLARKFNLTLHSLFEMSVETARRTYMNYDIPLCGLIAVVGFSEVQTNSNVDSISAIQDLVDAPKPSTHVLGPILCTWGGWSLSEVHVLLQSVKGDRGKLVEEARRKAGIPSSEDCYCSPLALQTLTTHLARKFNLTLHSLSEMSVAEARQTYGIDYDRPFSGVKSRRLMPNSPYVPKIVSETPYLPNNPRVATPLAYSFPPQGARVGASCIPMATPHSMRLFADPPPPPLIL